MPTLEEIERQLDELSAQRKELNRQKKLAEKGDVVQFSQSVVEYITNNGYDPREVASEIRRVTGPKRKVSSDSWALISNPELSYSRGPIPGWLQDEMNDIGLDFSSPSDRKKFRDDFMFKVGVNQEAEEDSAE
jgi:hypothetical protein